MLRGNGGQDIFFESADRKHFLGLIEEGVVRYRHRIHAFCLMANHVHFALQVGEVGSYCAMYNLTQGRYVAPFVILTLQGLTLELKEGNNGRVHHGTTIQAGVFTIHL